jgi:hypothetical protein
VARILASTQHRNRAALGEIKKVSGRSTVKEQLMMDYKSGGFAQKSACENQAVAFTFESTPSIIAATQKLRSR